MINMHPRFGTVLTPRSHLPDDLRHQRSNRTTTEIMAATTLLSPHTATSATTGVFPSRIPTSASSPSHSKNNRLSTADDLMWICTVFCGITQFSVNSDLIMFRFPYLCQLTHQFKFITPKVKPQGMIWRLCFRYITFATNFISCNCNDSKTCDTNVGWM